MTGCPQSSIETSVKCKNKNGRQTKPHPPLTLILEDSLRTTECSTDLQFLIYISHKEKFTSASIYTIHSLKGVTKRNDHPFLDMHKQWLLGDCSK